MVLVLGAVMSGDIMLMSQSHAHAPLPSHETVPSHWDFIARQSRELDPPSQKQTLSPQLSSWVVHVKLVELGPMGDAFAGDC